jgi:4-hydroxy-3-polyprenylbenzoate decarboxylase
METEYTPDPVAALADVNYRFRDIAAAISSGSFRTDGMVVIPCSMKTLASMANGFASTLIERAADVTIKEQRKLILVPRETPLSLVHVRNFELLLLAGAILLLGRVRSRTKLLYVGACAGGVAFLTTLGVSIL